MRADRTDEPRDVAADASPRAEESPAEAAPAAGTQDGEDARADAGEGEGPSAREAELGAELETLRDRYLRLAAEYENYRKRTERERSDNWVKAQAQLVEKLLDPLDDLQRVAHFTTETTSIETLLEGVQMVERKLLRVLEIAGLEAIDAHGQRFDPAEHEALMTAATQEREEDDTVGQVFQTGYRFKGDLLRPARVQVRKHGG